MIGLIGSLINLSWRILSFVLVINIFLALIRSGKDTVRDLRETTVMAIRLGISKLQRWLFNKYKEQDKKPDKGP